MNKTELAIIEQLAQLDEMQQERLLEVVHQLVNEKAEKPFSLGQWLNSAQQLRAELQMVYGENHYFNTQVILDEIRNIVIASHDQ